MSRKLLCSVFTTCRRQLVFWGQVEYEIVIITRSRSVALGLHFGQSFVSKTNVGIGLLVG